MQRLLGRWCAAAAGRAWWPALLACSVVLPEARATVFDFSAQYPYATASYNGGMVTLSVYDEAAGAQRTTNIASGATYDLTTSGGVAAWSTSSGVSCFTYDASLGRWVGESGAWGPTQDLRTDRGVITWSTSAGAVHYHIYDRARRLWMAGSAATAATYNLRAVDGVVAWSASSGAYARVYDPTLGGWRARDLAPLTVSDLANADGVVAVSSSAGVSCQVYDPTRAGWVSTTVNSGATFDLRCQQGVVAWSRDPLVYFNVYDPGRGLWMNGSASTGYAADLAISNAVVSWTSSSGSYQRGYDPGPGTWGGGPAVRLPYFALSTNRANAPLTVQCLDMSLGGLAWAWDFGDGGTSTARSPTHVFTRWGAFPVVQTVTGSSGSGTTARLVVTDVTPPAGTVVINGGDSLTTNRVVTLTLAASDNSGVVNWMRLSHDGATWSALEPYAGTRTWTLSTGDGTKTVHVQFADAATNLSATATDTITLDTSPLPVATVVSTNVAEGAGQVTVRVVLSAALARVVTVDYATSNGTAIAGLDYAAASGRLTFPAGSTAQTFIVGVLPDTEVEIHETFQVVLSNHTNALVGAPGTVTILNDDQPSVSFAGTQFTAAEGATNAVVTVRLSGASGQPVTVAWLATNGTATAGLDFVATNGVLTVPPGETNAFARVRILNDALDEWPETVQLLLTAATNASLAAPTNAVLTILDDDAPRVSLGAPLYPVLESDGFVQVQVRLSKPVADPVEFDYLVLGGSASPSDYLAASGHRVFSPGTTGLVLIVNITDDVLTEPDETVHVALSNFLRAEPGPYVEADVVIWDDDRGPRLLEPRRDIGGAFLATARGRAGQRFTLEVSSDLAAWFPLVTLTNATGTLPVSDPGAVGRPARFYRTSVAAP